MSDRVARLIEPRLYRLDDVARALGLSKRSVEAMIRRGELPTTKVPGVRAICVAREDLDAAIARWREASVSR